MYSLLAIVPFLTTGCGSEEGVQSYKVPRAATSEKSATGEARDYRILGAMYPADDPAWFFKLSGPAEQIAKFEADFDKLAASVQVRDALAVPTFTLPEGWTRGGPREGFVKVAETIKLPGSSLEITVIQSGGGVQQNLDRWIGQVGQSGPSSKYARAFDAVGGKGLRVDVTGPKNPAGGPMMGRKK